MRHYEIVFLVHQNQSAQVPEMIKRYKSIIKSDNGKVHRLEDWGLRRLAYPIQKSDEAYYVLMNIECTQGVLKEIVDSFHFSDAILRNLILSKEKPVIEHSPILRAMEKAKKSKHRKEQASVADTDTEKESSSEPDDKYIKKVDKNTPASEETNESNAQSDGSDHKKPDDDASLVEDNTQDTLTKNEHADSTKK